ncbi:SMR family transporter [Paenibacillus melissococcoides]|uniref:SMR family transporter n=1 Tax=Paenibacillus melissococcoides TaxID=2912268 RepID=A0ABM9G4R1_9BACL|nr:MULTISPECIES: SMR family transporter [Paenibacillus]MEB9898086.1 SMR family transporter [Bacillus cereus]CAH8246559.1 SMR family transporter [Paenibacillus melissococcoides]CAH8715106.1 SMR family transporter [Paenibacillus melissococcoides]CAH8716045.1 SMR family transporter [Paenibacillus melissococcoides]GIO82760.1 hypothetical protein J6TS7_63700 [Paenibacillus dendritiformis]
MLGGPLLVIFYFSFYCLAKAAKSLPVSTVAAAFAGIGAGGTVTMDMLLFDTGVNWVRLGLVALLICFILLLSSEASLRLRREDKRMEWLYVIIAGCFEVIGFLFVKRMSIRDTWTNNLLLGAFGVSLFLLTSALEPIPLGVAYSVWTGIGTIGTALAGMFFFKERAIPLRLVCIAGTVIGLRLTV